MRDYLRCTDLAHIPDELVAMYDTPDNLPAAAPVATNPH